MGELLFDGARHAVAQAKIDAARITQKSGNEKSAAESSLAEFSQSLSNQRKMTAAGEQANAIQENIGRSLDAATYGKLGERVGAAEELGSHLAQAASAGVGGSSIELFNRTVQMQQAMQEEQGDRATRSSATEAGHEIGSTIRNGVDSMSDNVYSANLDFTQYVDDHKQSTFGKLTDYAAAAAATYFGSPQAGMAVLSLGQADASAQNGDYAGAAKGIDNGLKFAGQGISTYRAGADADHTGKPWGDAILKQVGAIFHF